MIIRLPAEKMWKDEHENRTLEIEFESS